MSRCIDADALEKILEKIPAADIKNMGGQAYVLVKLSQVFNVIDNQPTIEPQQKWIPCSERMPEAGQKCLVCEKGTIAIDTYIGNGKPYDWRWYMRDYDAWMPLPEPYREGES